MRELKDCPFCGEKPSIVEMPFYVHQEKETHYHVICQCGARMTFCDTAEEATEAWNSRVNNEKIKNRRVHMPDEQLLCEMQRKVSAIDGPVRILIHELMQRYKEEKDRRSRAEFLAIYAKDDDTKPIGGIHD